MENFQILLFLTTEISLKNVSTQLSKSIPFDNCSSKKGELIMAKQKKLKGLITVAVTIILVILLSAGTSIIVNKQGAVQSSAKIKNGLSA